MYTARFAAASIRLHDESISRFYACSLEECLFLSQETAEIEISPELDTTRSHGSVSFPPLAILGHALLVGWQKEKDDHISAFWEISSIFISALGRQKEREGNSGCKESRK